MDGCRTAGEFVACVGWSRGRWRRSNCASAWIPCRLRWSDRRVCVDVLVPHRNPIPVLASARCALAVGFLSRGHPPSVNAPAIA